MILKNLLHVKMTICMIIILTMPLMKTFIKRAEDFHMAIDSWEPAESGPTCLFDNWIWFRNHKNIGLL